MSPPGEEGPRPKPLVRQSGEIKTPPFSKEARVELGFLLRRLQEGESLGMPHSRPMPSIGPRCHEIRVRDENRIWRVVYRLDPDAIVIAGVFSKTTRATSKHDIDDCRNRLKVYDEASRSVAESRERKRAMNKEKRRALEAAGFVFEDAEDFLELTAEERQLVELRLIVSRAIRTRREQQNLTQEQLARKLKSSQSRVAKMEAGAADVSLDLLFRGFFALGGTVKDLRLAR